MENTYQIKKIITVHIVYFDLGSGNDYIYKGTTTLLVTGTPSSTDSIENQLRIMKLTLKDNVY